MSLREKIEKRSAVIAVIGLGYVGLPLAVLQAKTGFRVWGIEERQTQSRESQRGSELSGGRRCGRITRNGKGRTPVGHDGLYLLERVRHYIDLRADTPDCQ